MIPWLSSAEVQRFLTIDLFLFTDSVLEFLDNFGLLISLIFSVLSLILVIVIWRRTRRKIKLKVEVLEGPNMISTYGITSPTSQSKHYQTALSLYLKVSNIGNTPASIEEIKVAYRKGLVGRKSWNWLSPSLCFGEFKYSSGINPRYYPFLLQKSFLTAKDTTTFLQPGESVKGMVYYEQKETNNQNRPYTRKDQKVKVMINLKDTYSKNHACLNFVSNVNLRRAREINPKFGQTRLLTKS